MRKISFLFILAISLMVLIMACSDRSTVNSVTSQEIKAELAADGLSDITTFYWVAIDWDGTTPLQPNTFYRIKNIDLAKKYFTGDEVLLNWLNSLPHLEESYTSKSSASNDGDQIVQVMVTKREPGEAEGPVLAAVGWSADATITPLSGGSVARCQTTTTNPAGVSGFKSHQIWVFNQNGYVYFADYWDTLNLLEHTVNFTHDRSVACDSTVRCMGRIVHNGVVKAYDVDTYVRSCN